MMGGGKPEAPAYEAPWGQSYWAISLDDVRRVSDAFLADLDPNLTTGEVLDFDTHFFAEAVEKDTGIGAYELMINFKDGKGTVLPALGPNQEWNSKYDTTGTAVAPEGRPLLLRR